VIGAVDRQDVTRDICLFIVGGWTYAEALAVYKFNRENQGKFRVSLAGTELHNSKSFLKHMVQVVSG